MEFASLSISAEKLVVRKKHSLNVVENPEVAQPEKYFKTDQNTEIVAKPLHHHHRLTYSMLRR